MIQIDTDTIVDTILHDHDLRCTNQVCVLSCNEPLGRLNKYVAVAWRRPLCYAKSHVKHGGPHELGLYSPFSHEHKSFAVSPPLRHKTLLRMLVYQVGSLLDSLNLLCRRSSRRVLALRMPTRCAVQRVHTRNTSVHGRVCALKFSDVEEVKPQRICVNVKTVN